MTTKRRLNQYTGRLSAAEIAEGMNAAGENALRLRRDAERLLEAGSFATAASLAILAVEEAGKKTVLRELAVVKTQKELAACWKSYRTHTAKNSLVFFLDHVAAGARCLDGFRSLFDPDSEHPHVAEDLKQVALYTDCLGRRHWSKPAEVISESLARTLVDAARVLTAHVSAVTVREVELWQQHMGAAWGRAASEMKAAVVDWHEALVVEGIKPKDESGGMESFVFGLPGRRPRGS
jgi:AbiV family abortive infection protein